MQDPKMQGVALYLMAFTKKIKNDVSKDQKRHKVDITENKAHDKSSQATKSISEPETTKKST